MREIKNNALFRQRIFWGDLDFYGLTFTDIDACMNFFEKIIIFIEIKRNGKEIGYAQRRAFETICNNLKINSIFIIAWHNETNIQNNINLKDCVVYKYYYKKKWHIKSKNNLAEFLNKITQYYK